MKNPERKAPDADEASVGAALASVADRRAAPRAPFVAEAQIVEVTSGVRLSARSCDLVLQGCYVDTLRPFPVGTQVRIRLKKDGTAIEASGTVVYEQPRLGMGIAFRDLGPDSQAAIDKWISEKEPRETPIEALLPPLEDPPQAYQQQPGTKLEELVRLLNRKGILTKSETDRFLEENDRE
jgi:hypothetical protein